MFLFQLKPGQEATVLDMQSLPSETRKKLMVMGVLPQTPVKMIRRAPMGDPIQIEVRGVSIALRNSIAESIKVEVKG
ncbi:FeoA family protein [Vibrio sp. FNV 38]|nr:FeoA family protein [Vibrio sp. FNV 38]